MAKEFYNDAHGYISGDVVLIERMVKSWSVFSGAIELPEYQNPMSVRDYNDLLNWRASQGG